MCVCVCLRYPYLKIIPSYKYKGQIQKLSEHIEGPQSSDLLLKPSIEKQVFIKFLLKSFPVKK